MSDVITMTAEQLRARDMQVAEATESKLIAGGYIALTKAQIADVVASVGGPQVQAAPVNQQLVAAAKDALDEADWHYAPLSKLALETAIDAAEAAQPIVGVLEVQIADLELALFAENQKRLETEQLRDQLVAALEDAVRLLRAAGYAMSGTATTPMLATIATAKAAQHGALIDEDSKQPASAQPVAQGGTRP